MFLRAVRLLPEQVGDPEAYPWSLPVVRALDELAFPTPVTILVGENGSGKSTLLEAIAVAVGLNPEGGTANTTHATRASHSALHEALRPVRGTARPRTSFFLRAESVFTLATEIEALDAEPEGGPPIIDAYGGRSLHEQSHGESFLAIATHRLGPTGSTCSTSRRPRSPRRASSRSSPGSATWSPRAASSSSRPTPHCSSLCPARRSTSSTRTASWW